MNLNLEESYTLHPSELKEFTIDLSNNGQEKMIQDILSFLSDDMESFKFKEITIIPLMKGFRISHEKEVNVFDQDYYPLVFKNVEFHETFLLNTHYVVFDLEVIFDRKDRINPFPIIFSIPLLDGLDLKATYIKQFALRFKEESSPDSSLQVDFGARKLSVHGAKAFSKILDYSNSFNKIISDHIFQADNDFKAYSLGCFHIFIHDEKIPFIIFATDDLWVIFKNGQCTLRKGYEKEFISYEGFELEELVDLLDKEIIKFYNKIYKTDHKTSSEMFLVMDMRNY